MAARRLVKAAVISLARRRLARMAAPRRPRRRWYRPQPPKGAPGTQPVPQRPEKPEAPRPPAKRVAVESMYGVIVQCYVMPNGRVFCCRGVPGGKLECGTAEQLAARDR